MSFLGSIGNFIGDAAGFLTGTGLPLGTIASVAGDIFGTLQSQHVGQQRQEDSQQFAAGQQQLAENFNAEQAGLQRDWATGEAVKQRDYDKFMSDTAIERRMTDLGAAGVNPLLAIAQGGASTPSAGIPSGSSASVSPTTTGIASPTPFHSIASGLASATQAAVNQATVGNIEAQTSKTKAEENEIIARTPTYAVNIQKAQQDIQESQTRIGRILQETETSAATAANLAQQTKNLQEIVPQIQANIQNLKALTAKSYAEIGLTQSQKAAMDQTVQANLPKLEAAVKELERQRMVITQPSLEMESSTTGQGFIGALSATMRALNPFNNFLGAAKK